VNSAGDHFQMVKRIVEAEIHAEARAVGELQIGATFQRELAARFDREPERALRRNGQAGRKGRSVRENGIRTPSLRVRSTVNSG
jgi:hypothetical protein